LLVIVTVYASGAPAAPVCAAGAMSTVGVSRTHGWITVTSAVAVAPPAWSTEIFGAYVPPVAAAGTCGVHGTVVLWPPTSDTSAGSVDSVHPPGSALARLIVDGQL